MQAGPLIRLSAWITSVALVFAVFKAPVGWTGVALFGFSYPLMIAAATMGAGSITAVFALAAIGFIIGSLKIMGASMPIYTAGLELAVLVAAFVVVKAGQDMHRYKLSAMQDALKGFEAEHDALVIEKKNLETGIEANKQKVAKYLKLKQIREGLASQGAFAEKLRYVMRSMVEMFHSEQNVTLFLIKENKSMKVTADKESDMAFGERDQESLYLKSFDEWVIKNKKSIIITDMMKEIRFKADNEKSIRSLISVPVFLGEEVVGIMRVSSKEAQGFHQEDLRFLDLVAVVISGVLKGENYA